ncbi:hypothetical protein phiPsa374_157 [Pseudomonas phage phiPsa374]|uniref:Uncharacterized protein n=1 Tax=Pseudomonas phage phiPsa374 TaxID=1458843 RepID=W8EIP6_9CAUD|nr:hypothetical protein CF96_gp063 [Pseudomonas phage phiPsa374]AHJ87417.1 hypothetical protein phiPsa374_157 [Pseudomonas phage phiPsa374]
MSLKNMQYRKTSHFGHAILSILFFPWVIVWAIIALSNNNYNNNLDVIHAIQTNGAK